LNSQPMGFYAPAQIVATIGLTIPAVAVVSIALRQPLELGLAHVSLLRL